MSKQDSREQSARAAVMVRPHCFFPNPETALDNSFQGKISANETAEVTRRAQAEFDRAAEMLTAAGVKVHCFQDTPQPEKPDAVFPNNWFSTHEDGRVALYPMHAASRRSERRLDIIEELRRDYLISEVIDYTGYEARQLALEGTGSLVLDHLQKVAYVSLSQRADSEPLEKFCADFGYEPMTFTSSDGDGQPIYHTNVVMCLGTNFALIGLRTIADPTERAQVWARLENSGRTIFELSGKQIANFAGNALELQNEREKLLVLSQRAADSLSAKQRRELENFARLVPLELPTIELAGGSARCMLASVHLPAR